MTRATLANPAQADPHYNLGVALGELGRHDEAVASYARACALGHCSIWSLEKLNARGVEKLVTIELARGQIVQVRGRFNRAPTASEIALVRAWAQAQNMSMSGFVLIE